MSKHVKQTETLTINLLNSAIAAIEKGDSLAAEMFIHDALDKVWWLQEEQAITEQKRECPECHTTNCHRKNGNPYCSTTLKPGWQKRVYTS